MTTRSGGHRRGGSMGRWKGWNGLAPVRPASPMADARKARNEPPVWKNMTAKQASYLGGLCARAGVPFDRTWTRSEASRRIDMLKLGERVDGKRAQGRPA